MIRLLLVAFAFSWGGVFSVTADESRKDEDGPIEIDFSSLPGMGADVEYKVRLTLQIADGSGMKGQGYNIGKNTNPKDVAELIQRSLSKKFEAERDGAKLIVKSFDGKPITKVEVKVFGLPQDAKGPTAKRLPKKDKEPEKK
jgi:hypothetical protein